MRANNHSDVPDAVLLMLLGIRAFPLGLSGRLQKAYPETITQECFCSKESGVRPLPESSPPQHIAEYVARRECVLSAMKFSVSPWECPELLLFAIIGWAGRPPLSRRPWIAGLTVWTISRIVLERIDLRLDERRRLPL